MKVSEVKSESKLLLKALHLSFREVALNKGLPNVLVIEQFGSVLAPIHSRDYIQVMAKLEELFPTYRYLYITQHSNMLKAKDNIVWELMRSGYMTYIRESFPAQFKKLIIEYGYGRKILNERLRIWNKEKKYIYLIKEIELMLEQPMTRIFALNPGFFDFMPEEK